MTEPHTRKHLLHTIFVTALEGGIGYWAGIVTYHWSKGHAGIEEDLDGFYAVIDDIEEETDSEPNQYRIDFEVIERGLEVIRSGKAKLHKDYAQRILYADLFYQRDDYDLDASDCDAIVQAGLFGDVIYG